MQFKDLQVGMTVGFSQYGGRYVNKAQALKATIVGLKPRTSKSYGYDSAKATIEYVINSTNSFQTDEDRAAWISNRGDDLLTCELTKGASTRWPFCVKYTQRCSTTVLLTKLYPWAECEAAAEEERLQRIDSEKRAEETRRAYEAKRLEEQAERERRAAAIKAEDEPIIEAYDQALLRVVSYEHLKQYPPRYVIHGKEGEREMDHVEISPELFSIITNVA